MSLYSIKNFSWRCFPSWRLSGLSPRIVCVDSYLIMNLLLFLLVVPWCGVLSWKAVLVYWLRTLKEARLSQSLRFLLWTLPTHPQLDWADLDGIPWWGRVCLPCRRPGFNPWVGKISWRRKWHPTPVFLPGKSHGWGILAGYIPAGHNWATSISFVRCLDIHK